ncbi:MAG: hypothetical protein ABIJ09_24950 [Pseudomonadota bacterium]
MKLCATLLTLSLLGLSPPAAAEAPVPGSASDLRGDEDAATRELLRTFGNLGAIVGGALAGMGVTLLSTYTLVFYEEVRVGLTQTRDLDGAPTPVVTDLTGYRLKMSEGQSLWTGGWLSLSAGLSLALVGAGLSMTPQLFLDASEE